MELKSKNWRNLFLLNHTKNCLFLPKLNLIKKNPVDDLIIQPVSRFLSRVSCAVILHLMVITQYAFQLWLTEEELTSQIHA